MDSGKLEEGQCYQLRFGIADEREIRSSSGDKNIQGLPGKDVCCVAGYTYLKQRTEIWATDMNSEINI